MQTNSDAMREALRMAQSPEAQQLLTILRRSGGRELEQAMEQAAAGDYRAAKALLGSLIQDPQAQKLMKQMGGSHGSDGR